jgi:predicted Fe-Mo cluster-binding NifX family protein
VPSESDRGLEAAVAAHLGRAPFLTVVDTETGVVDVLANAPHGDRSCAPGKPLLGAGVEAVVCSGAGKRAVASLAAVGVRVMVTNASRVDGAVAALRGGALRVLSAKEACGGRHGHGGAEPSGCDRHGMA